MIFISYQFKRNFGNFSCCQKLKVLRNWTILFNDVRIHIPLKNIFQLIVQAWVVDMCSFRNASHASYLLATSSRYLRRYRVSRTWEMLSNEAAKMINQLTPDISSNDFWKNVVSFSMTHNVGFFFLIWIPAINAT